MIPDEELETLAVEYMEFLFCHAYHSRDYNGLDSEREILKDHNRNATEMDFSILECLVYDLLELKIAPGSAKAHRSRIESNIEKHKKITNNGEQQ